LRSSDWSSDVCASDLRNVHQVVARGRRDDAFVTLRLSKYDLHSSPTLLSVARFTNRHISIVDSYGKADISRNPIDKSGKTAIARILDEDSIWTSGRRRIGKSRYVW